MKAVYFLLIAVLLAGRGEAFTFKSNRRTITLLRHASIEPTEPIEAPLTKVGSKEYYKGFLVTPLEEDTSIPRGDGLEQALKLGGAAGIGLVALVAAFLISNLNTHPPPL
jgi:hypothetical protein